MALIAGRKGVNKKLVDYLGRIKGGAGPVDTYTKTEINSKLALKEDKTSIGGLEFRNNNGQGQYRVNAESEWKDFNGGQPIVPVADGKTVLPINDTATWLTCIEGGSAYGYTTLSEVLADTTCLLALIGSNNACDYLARSTGFADDITSNETAMTYIKNNSYCEELLLEDDTWFTAIMNSDYVEVVLNVKVPTMTSVNTPYGEVIGQTAYEGATYYAFNSTDTQYWLTKTLTPSMTYIAYKFDEPTIINKVSIKNLSTSGSNLRWSAKTYYLKGSNDGSTWNTIGSLSSISNETALAINTNVFKNTSSYLYYGIFPESNIDGSNQYVGVTQLQFFGREA